MTDFPFPPQNLELSDDNPSPFIQPFLELIVGGPRLKELGLDTVSWLVEVDGQIGKYITKGNASTKLLNQLCESLANAGIMVKGFDRYKGSAGPHVVLLNGALFYRMSAIERVPPEVWAYKFRPPVYRGGKGG